VLQSSNDLGGSSNEVTMMERLDRATQLSITGSSCGE